MRYQRVSPDYLPLTNGRKPGGGLRTTCIEGNESPEHGRLPAFSSPSSLEAKSVRARTAKDSQQNFSPEPPPLPSEHYDGNTSVSPAHKSMTNHLDISNGVAGDLLLQWGHNKRSRGSRSESRYTAAAIITGGHDSGNHSRRVIKVQRRAAAAATLCGPYTRGVSLRPCTPVRDCSGPLLRSAAEERSSGQSRSEKRGHPFPPEKLQKMVPTANGFTSSDATVSAKTDSKPSSEHESGGAATGNGGVGATDKLNLEQFEWPRIYISLSRKEKEDDFLAMKGTKLPQRPKKRAKNKEKTLQYCFPGMWLSDLTKGRYEVREKKCVKKQKRRGLKGMESMDSDSE